MLDEEIFISLKAKYRKLCLEKIITKFDSVQRMDHSELSIKFTYGIAQISVT